MEYRYSTGDWRIGPSKTKNSYRKILMTEDCTELLKKLKKKVEFEKTRSGGD